MKPHVLTRTTSASSPSPRSVQPPAARRAASSSESTSLRAQPRVTMLTERELGTCRGYAIGGSPLVSPLWSADGDRGLAGRVDADVGHLPRGHLLRLAVHGER